MKMIKNKRTDIRYLVSDGKENQKFIIRTDGIDAYIVSVHVKDKPVKFSAECTGSDIKLKLLPAPGLGDQIVVEYSYSYEVSEASVKFDAYLESIGGLENGYRPYKPAIKSATFFDCDDGWLGLIENLIREIIEAGWDKQVCQVKEKFGGLRFYINEGSKEVHDIITKYEHQSYTVCEVCGEPGKLRTNLSWIKTKCDKHYGG